MLNHAAAAETMREAFRAEHGRDPEPRELLFCLAVAAAETSYGQGWTGKQAACNGSNNWGARQLTKAEQEKGVPGCGATDSHPDGERYEQLFRVYASPVEGARDVVRLLTKQRARTWAVMRDRVASVYDFSEMLRRDRYYGGFCPAASKQFGRAVQTYGDPKTDAATACHLEAAKAHAEKFIGPHVGPIAMAIGMEPPPLYRPGAEGGAADGATFEAGPAAGRKLAAAAGLGGLILYGIWRVFR